MAQINQQQMLPMGTVLGSRYRIVRYLASGGFGNTYVAEHTSLGRQVAVKEFFMRGTNHRSQDGTTVEVSNDENTTVFQSQLEKFRREARRIFDLHNDHIIHVTDLFDANGTSYYVMDLVDGTSLSEQTRQQPLSEKEALDVTLQVLDALETMHASGLFHLDVKPGNIMRDNRGHCTLIDFGASKQLSADERATLSSSSMAYTPGYAPLEQVAQQSKSIGPWTDFFALGATLYKLVTGSTPPEVEVGDTAPDGRQFPYPSSVSATLRHAISTLMNPDRRLRPQNATEVCALLEGQPQPEETVINSPTPEPTDEQTQHTLALEPSPQPDTPTPNPSHDIPQDPSSSQFIPDEPTPSSLSSRKGLWYGISGLAAVVLLVVLLAKGCNTKKMEDGTLAGYTQCPDSNHPHLVDLGLPSGTKWACCNVDANSPEDYGGYYAWGETDEKFDYSWDSYSHCDGSEESCHDLGSSICGTQYDVAHVRWGGSWQMPTFEQIKELLDNCDSEWTTVNGVYGRRLTGPNGDSIFLPARGTSGSYWSGTQSASNRGNAYSLCFRSDGAYWSSYNYRSYGLGVRPVAR